MQVPHWALNRLQTNNNYRHSINQAENYHNNHPTNNNCNSNKIIYLVVPYTKALSKSFRNVCRKVGIQVNFIGGNVIKNLPVAPKDRDKITQETWIIYRYKWYQVDCKEEYIEMSTRTYGGKLKEHLRAPSVTMVKPQGITSVYWTISPQWAGRYTTLLWPPRGQVHQGQWSMP